MEEQKQQNKTKKVKEEHFEEAVWIVCRECGLEYIESKEWIMQDFKTDCPFCKSVLKVC